MEPEPLRGRIAVVTGASSGIGAAVVRARGRARGARGASLDEQDRLLISGKLKEYQRGFRAIIDCGCSLGRFSVESPRIASFAILEMLNGLAVWFSETGSLSEDVVVRQYGDFA